MSCPGGGDQVCGVTRHRDADRFLVALWIIDARGGCPTFGVSEKIVVVDLLRFLAPCLAAVFELPNQFLFLGVHADPRVARTTKIQALFGNVAKLQIAFGVLLSRVQHFAMTPQSEFLLSQQATDRGGTTALVQRFRQPAQPRPHPLLFGTRIAHRLGGHPPDEILD